MKFIVFDLEATCWLGSPPNDVQEIIEIGAIMMDNYGTEISTFNKFVRPRVNQRLSAFCVELTTIKQEWVDRANYFPEVIEMFQDWAQMDEDDYLLASWGPDDMRMLHSDCRLHDVAQEWLSPRIDLKKQYTRIRMLRKPAGLRKALRLEGIEFEGTAHRAIDDAINTGKIFKSHLDEWQY
ncbi:MAG: exonuclease domain-containing protein [Saprospiraceae bacterium]|nr:exonuclease domain-containing protein [Saprospiraceae bacterium]